MDECKPLVAGLVLYVDGGTHPAAAEAEAAACLLGFNPCSDLCA